MEEAFTSRDAAELAFLDDPLVRLAGAFDPVLAVITLGRQELYDFIDAIHAVSYTHLDVYKRQPRLKLARQLKTG